MSDKTINKNYRGEYRKALRDLARDSREGGKVPSHMRKALKSHAKSLARLRAGVRGRLLHVDYDCEGVVKASKQFGLVCSECGHKAAFGPMTVVVG